MTSLPIKLKIKSRRVDEGGLKCNDGLSQWQLVTFTSIIIIKYIIVLYIVMVTII